MSSIIMTKCVLLVSLFVPGTVPVKDEITVVGTELFFTGEIQNLVVFAVLISGSFVGDPGFSSAYFSSLTLSSGECKDKETKE